jgi:hypothetical protein
VSAEMPMSLLGGTRRETELRVLIREHARGGRGVRREIFTWRLTGTDEDTRASEGG